MDRRDDAHRERNFKEFVMKNILKSFAAINNYDKWLSQG